MNLGRINKPMPFILKRKDSPLNMVKSGPCQIWYDGKDEDTFELYEETGRVIQWDDKGLQAAHVSNLVDGQRPTWDVATGRVTFNSVAQTYLQSAAFDAPLVQPITIFVLYKLKTIHAGRILDGIVNNFSFFYSNIFDGWYIAAGVNLIYDNINTNDNIHCGQFGGINSNHWINGILNPICPADAGNNNMDGITLGCRKEFDNYANAELCEVFGYNCSITLGERIKCENYLYKKWGLTY